MRDLTGAEAAHVEQVADEIVEPSRLVVDGVEQLVARLRRPIDVGGEQARGRGPDRRERRAQVVAHCGEERVAQFVGAGLRDRLLGFALQQPTVARERDLRGERREHFAFFGRETAA